MSGTTTSTTTQAQSATGSTPKQQFSCPSPEQIFAVATGFAAFLSSNLNQTEMQTLINLFTLLNANLIAIVTQKEICDGISVVSESDFLP